MPDEGLELHVIPPVSRVERYFPTRAGKAARVLLVNPAQDTSVPPLDFLKLSTFLRNRGYKSVLLTGALTKATVKGVTKLITSWRAHLSAKLPRVEVWDNTLMLTPREHFVRVAQVLAETEKPVDLVCGLMPSGVEETELHWRIGQLAGVQLRPARLECNVEDELPRFFRLLARTRDVFGEKTEYRAFAVVNGTESPLKASARIDRLRAEGVQVDVVRFTPHDWEHRRPYVNHAAGWTADDLAAVCLI